WVARLQHERGWSKGLDPGRRVELPAQGDLGTQLRALLHALIGLVHCRRPPATQEAFELGIDARGERRFDPAGVMADKAAVPHRFLGADHALAIDPDWLAAQPVDILQGHYRH